MRKKAPLDPQPDQYDAALLEHIPKEIRDNKTFKDFMGLIEGHPYKSILLSLLLGLLIGQQIKDFD